MLPCVSLQLTVLLDTAVVPEELKPYLSLYLEVIFESPLLRDGGTVCFLTFSTNIGFSSFMQPCIHIQDSSHHCCDRIKI